MPFAVLLINFEYCIGQIIKCGIKHIIVAKITPVVPNSIFLEKNMESGMFIIAINTNDIN